MTWWQLTLSWLGINLVFDVMFSIEDSNIMLDFSKWAESIMTEW